MLSTASGWVTEKEYPTSVMKWTMPSMGSGVEAPFMNSVERNLF
jgi:hypothetical protein